MTVIGSLGTLTDLPSAVSVLQPQSADVARSNTYSGNYGFGEFPLHTDFAHWFVPPRYMALRAVVGSEHVSTRVFDGRHLIESRGSASLQRMLVQPRRPILGQRALLQILQEIPPDVCLRWDPLFLVAATASSTEDFESIREWLARSTCDEVTLRDPGDVLLIDNWRMLHGRSAVYGGSSDRQLERAYLESVF